MSTLFFEDQSGNAVTVNAERYLQMLNEYLFNKLVDKGMDPFHFQSNIMNVTSSIDSVTLQNVMASTVERMRKCLAADGGHLKYVIFKN